ncbi:MAG: hypothetical protein NVS9B9_19420 [Ktedonobacteraceae bacterium]
MQERHITLTMSDATKSYLALRGYDPQFGARPLKRVLQKEVENRIARAILDGTLHDGGTINMDIQDGALTMTIQ